MLLVGLGGGLGSMLRYFCQRSLNAAFPYGTLLVNVLGCFIIGLLWGIFNRHIDESKRLFLVTGFCGGFTTFSSFTYEGVQLILENRWFTFAIYTIISITAGLLATFLGFKLTN
jgi:CrcB protein